MTVKVIITRHFKQGKDSELIGYLKQLRAGGIKQSGYISGETMCSLENPQKMVVISVWETKKQWERWQNDPVRKMLENKMERLLLEPANYELFSYRTVGDSD